MITSNMTGNVGNHMWIYAITRAVAEKNNYEWGFNPIPSHDYYNGLNQMAFMNIDFGKIHNYKYEETPPWITNIWQEKYETTIYPNGDKVDFQPFQPEIFNIPDNTKLFIRCCQDARYLEDIKDNVKNWFSIQDSYMFDQMAKKYNIVPDDNLCIINVRGGEYKGIPFLILRKKYWDDAIKIMKDRNPNMRFYVITDDPTYARTLFDFPCMHFSIGFDYYSILTAKNLILSNSSFAILPAWLNENNPFIIAPKYWARHNISTGYWCSSDMTTFRFNFLDREGNLS